MNTQWLRDSFFGQCIRHICKPAWSEYPEEEPGWIEATDFDKNPSQNEKIIRVEWYSDTDEENPRNWTQAKKAFVTGVIGAYSFVVYMSAPIYTPGENSFIEEFHVSNAEAALGLAIYV
jgi:DHA1 family multidrug resistance protein-like MFS transporter